MYLAVTQFTVVMIKDHKFGLFPSNAQDVNENIE